MSEERRDLYNYNPSIAPAVIFILAFGAVLGVKLWDWIRFHRGRSSSFPFSVPQDYKVLKQTRKQVTVSLIPICLGFLFQVLGYIMRILSISGDNRYKLTLYVIPSAFTLISPSLMSGGVFMIFNRIQRFLNGEKHTIIPNKYMTAFFVTGDVLSFLVQVSGAGLLVQDGSKDLGLRLGLVGFGMQLFFFALFIVVASAWLVAMKRKPTDVSRLMDSNALGVRYYHWNRLVFALIGSMILILIRCVLRMIEFAQQVSGESSFADSEAAYYMIDPFLIFWSAVLLVAIRPEYRLWEMKGYELWSGVEREQRAYPSDNLERASILVENKVVDV